MTRNEFYLACLLVFLILAGIAYRDRVGGNETQPVLITPESLEDLPAPPEIPSATETVNVNSADEDQLDKVPGIDRELAGNIIAFRERYGLFSDLRELMEVPGIDRKCYQDLRPYMRLADLPEILSPPPPVTNNTMPGVAPPVVREGGKNPVYIPLVPRQAMPIQPARSQPRQGLRDLNQATLAELNAVDGIGDVLAQRILDARTKRRGFRSWQEVREVDGIGTSRLKKLQEHFTIQGR
ncbi:MAG TPA: helix-hairpin-helix domain-containing protein [bacterium]|nr:helix-hairpin-helix domain-containing protein [bacterium]